MIKMMLKKLVETEKKVWRQKHINQIIKIFVYLIYARINLLIAIIYYLFIFKLIRERTSEEDGGELNEQQKINMQ